jgi:hypothetical protein|tara:strand:+ start:4201 stop:4452 length:252 start_codon:yes stop_codon:yes gene_type:complete
MSEKTETTEEVKTETPVADAATEGQAPADLSVQDLQALKMIIDVASSRGAFKPNEMVQIGQTYNKLDGFLAAVAAQQPSPEGA